MESETEGQSYMLTASEFRRKR